MVVRPLCLLVHGLHFCWLFFVHFGVEDLFFPHTGLYIATICCARCACLDEAHDDALLACPALLWRTGKLKVQVGLFVNTFSRTCLQTVPSGTREGRMS